MSIFLTLLNIDQQSVSSTARRVNPGGPANARAMIAKTSGNTDGARSAKSRTGLILDGKYVVGVDYEEYMDVTGWVL